MAVLVDTALVEPRDRFALWSEAASQIFFPLAVRPRSPLPFRGRVVGLSVGGISVFGIEPDPSTVLRTREAIAAGDPEHLLLLLMLRGKCEVSQDDRSSTLSAPDISTYQTSRLFRIEVLEPLQGVIFSIPHQLLQPYTDRLLGQTATRISGASGLGALVGPFLRGLYARLADGTVDPAEHHLQESVLDVVQALYARRLPFRDEPRRRSLTELRLRIHAYIKANLHDPGLSPESVARANYVSTRYLHKMFEKEGVSVCEWIKELRLDRCRRELEDSELRGERIFDIAGRWGFRNSGYFSSLFRAKYGLAPREFRKQRLDA